jgi:hypothetical protein
MIMAATADLTDMSEVADEPLLNFGLVEVIGRADMRAELEIERAPATEDRPIRPFLNKLISDQPDPPASRGGLISAQHATLRFGSGLLNESRLAFTAGTNIVHGDVMSIGPADIIADDDADGDIGDYTELLVSGPGTQVIFNDQLGSGGNADVNLENGGNITAMQDFAITTGEISIELSRENPSSITVLGDLGLDFVEFNLKLANDVFPIAHGDAFEIINFGGELGGVDLTDPLRPVPDLTVAPSIAEISVSPLIPLLDADLVTVIEFADEGIYAVFLDPTMVGPPGGPGAMGPDFNGDGMVDLDDLAIWEMFEGCEAGCSVLQGDADGDGDVDGDDLLFWQRNVGMPPPWAGAGAGAGASSGGALGAVPEPTGLALLVSGGLLALAHRRSRRPAH